MRKLGTVLALLFYTLGVARADIEIVTTDDGFNLSLDANVRARYELDARDFNADTGMSDYGNLRTMIGVKVQPNDHVLLRAKFKESRYLGTQQSNNLPTAQLQMQEAYMRVNRLWDKDIALQVGRFEMSHGRYRILGTGTWNINGPRAYDGVLVNVETGYGSWDLAAAKIIDYEQAGLLNATYGTAYQAENADRNLFVLAGSLLDGSIQPLLTADLDNSLQGADDPTHIYTAGVYLNRTIGAFRLDADAAVQTGTKNDRDLSSWLLAVDARYSFDGARKPYLGVGVDIASGNKYDEDSATDNDQVFYTPFMSRHRFKGLMDYFRDVRRGLVDGVVHAGLKLWTGARLDLDIHNFAWFAEDRYLDTNGKPVTFTQLGQEADLRLRFPVYDAVSVDAAWCVFLPNDDWKPDGDPSHFAYLAITTTF